jgi:hypothetical protein
VARQVHQHVGPAVLPYLVEGRVHRLPVGDVHLQPGDRGPIGASLMTGDRRARA